MQRVAFVSIIVAAVGVAACGRQVTPNPPGLGPGGAPPGYIGVFFNVAGTLNFSSYRYIVVFNTTGDGRTPSTDTLQTNWDGYSYAIAALGNGFATFAQAVQFRRSTINPHIPPVWFPLHTTPQLFSFNLNANGTGTEFSVLAQRRIFSSPGPSPSPTSNVWTFNGFVAQVNGSGEWLFNDSMGAGGPTDPQWVSPKLCMTEPFDTVFNSLGFVPPDPSSQITTIEIANNPASPSPCP